MKKLLSSLHTPTWLFVLMAIVMIFRIPSFFEPYSYGDEMIYLALGEAVRQNIPLYKGIHDNKPPLLYITAAVAGSLFWFKAILAIWHTVTIFIFWKLSEVLFPKNIRLQKVATIIFSILTTIPLLEGNIANAELFMIGPAMLGFYILLSKKLNFKNIFSAGMLFSIATLFKVPAAFDIPAIILYWLVTNKLNKKSVLEISKNTLYLLAGFIFPIALTFIWYFFRGALSEYAIAAFLQNFGYLSTWRPDDVQKPFLEKNGALLIRGLITFVGMLILYWKRKKLSKQFIFLTAWLLLTLFAVALSERPYPHYLIQSVPAGALLFGILVTKKTKEQVLAIFPLTLAFLVPVYFNFWYYPTAPYYLRFYKFATNQISKESYFESFGGNTIPNYKISEFITENTTKEDKVFVWGNSSVIYALSRRLPPGRYVANYHIRDFSSEEETIEVLRNDLPEVVVILPDAPAFGQLNIFLRGNYIQTQPINKAQVWKLLKLNPNSFTSF